MLSRAVPIRIVLEATKGTPARLRQDFQAEPLAKERLDRLRAVLDGNLISTPEGVQLPLGEGKAARLIKEGDSFKVAAIE